MAAEATRDRPQVKACLQCGADVTTRRRFKNPMGDYYCESCYTAAVGNTAAAAAR